MQIHVSIDVQRNLNSIFSGAQPRSFPMQTKKQQSGIMWDYQAVHGTSIMETKDTMTILRCTFHGTDDNYHIFAINWQQ
jgi:hypothetical protein